MTNVLDNMKQKAQILIDSEKYANILWKKLILFQYNMSQCHVKGIIDQEISFNTRKLKE